MRPLLLALFLPLAAAAAAPPVAPVKRHETRTVVAENIPQIPDRLWERMNRYQNTRAAISAGWVADGRGQFISTRFASATQVHWVAEPGAARQQLTFSEEPLTAAIANPKRAGFVYGRDVGGSEFWQLFWFDLDSRESLLLTDGESRNERPVWSGSGEWLAFSTTRRTGADSDIHLVGLDGKPSRPLVERGGSWFAAGFSSDDARLLVSQYVSINETRPYIVDIASGELSPLFDPDRKVAYHALAFANGDRGIVYSSDEDSEFQRLRYRDLASGETRVLSAGIDWDVEQFLVSPDGTRVVFVANEDGYSTPHLLSLPDGAELPLPALPKGVMQPTGFSADGRSIAFTVATPTHPGDAYSVRSGADAAVRWTHSEVGGLDPERFVEPTLVRYPTFDRVDGKRRTIPAFYFRPRGEGPFPVVVRIHGGPESQARPLFDPEQQFMLNEMGIAVLVPNVRGSRGYGKGYLLLDNAGKREDSVRDIGALLDWIGRQPELDAGRVGVLGGSYGGYMVLASMARYGERLRAGIDIVGISNFVTFLENTQDYRRDLRRAEYGDERIPEMRRFLTRISPTTSAGKISRPLFVAQGANDPRVPASESEQIVRTVRENGTEVWYLLFKDEGHGFKKKPNRDYFGAAAMLFWQKFLLGQDAAEG